MTDKRKEPGDDRAQQQDDLAPFASLSDDVRQGLHYDRPVAAPGLERRAVAGAWLKMRRRRLQRFVWGSGLCVAAAAAIALVAMRWAPVHGPLSGDTALAAAGSDGVSAPARPNDADDNPAAGQPPPAAPAPTPRAPTAGEDDDGDPREAELAERERLLAERERLLEQRSRELEARLVERDRQRDDREGSVAGALAELAGALERARLDIERLEREFESNADQLSRAEIADFKDQLRDRWRRVKELERLIEQKAVEAARRASAVGQEASRRAMALEREASRRAVEAIRRENADRDRAEREVRQRERERVRRLRLRGEGGDSDWRWEWQWRKQECDGCGPNDDNHDGDHSQRKHSDERDPHGGHEDSTHERRRGCDSCDPREQGGFHLNFQAGDNDGELDFDVVLELDDETAAWLDGAAAILGSELGSAITGDDDSLGEAVADLIEGAVEQALQQAEAELEHVDEDLARDLRRELSRAKEELESEAEDVRREVQQALDDARGQVDDAALRRHRTNEVRLGTDGKRPGDTGLPDAVTPRSTRARGGRQPAVAAPDLEAYRQQVRESYRQRQQTDADATRAPDATERGTIDIRSNPPGATIVVNGRKVGTAPRQVSLEPGTHTISVIGRSGVEIARDVTVKAGETLRISDDFR